MERSVFVCPICRETLTDNGKSLICPGGHCFDRAKSGYVNLFLSHTGAQHGDDKAMVRARTRFLESGYYLPLSDAICGAIKTFAPDAAFLLDAGCGEGWYTDRVRRFLRSSAPTVAGVDLSRDALSVAARRCPDAEFAVASLFRIPLPDSFADVVLNIFAPLSAAEFVRVLKPNGILLRVIPMPDHLMELKRILYDSVYENPEAEAVPDGFELRGAEAIRYQISLPDNGTISDLFTMTPYYYRTAPSDRAKLDGIHTLNVTAAFDLRVYQKSE